MSRRKSTRRLRREAQGEIKTSSCYHFATITRNRKPRFVRDMLSGTGGTVKYSKAGTPLPLTRREVKNAQRDYNKHGLSLSAGGSGYRVFYKGMLETSPDRPDRPRKDKSTILRDGLEPETWNTRQHRLKSEPIKPESVGRIGQQLLKIAG